jgi:uroporphyrinogen decarboxylase
LKNLDRLVDYQFPSADALRLTDGLKGIIRDGKNEGKIIFGELYHMLFERIWALMGLESFMTALYERPEELKFVLHKIAEFVRAVFARYIEMGLDGIYFSEDLGTQRALMVSPTVLHEFFFPEYHFILQDALAEKKLINFHSCGCIQQIAGELAGLGISILNPVQARANDLVIVKEATVGKAALQGAIDTNMLCTGTPEAVRHETLRVLSILQPGGGYILGPDQDNLPFKPENMQAMRDAAREFGRY